MTGRALSAGIAVLFAVGAASALADRIEPAPKDLEGVGITEHAGARLPLDLQFVAEDGSTVKLGSYFDGRRPVILNLGYYRCPMLCGLVLNGLLEGLKELPWDVGKEFVVVTLSIDPLETPTLARFKKQTYLESYGRPGAAQGWHFLTGKEADIRRLADAVGFGYRYVPEREQYAHPAVLFVTTGDGRLARYLYGVLYAPGTLRMALAEAGEGKIGTTTDQILLFCFHYDSAQGRYVVAANVIMRIGGVLTILAVGGLLLYWWRRESRVARPRPEERTS